MRHFIPVPTTDAGHLADAFISGVYRLHGTPDTIVSDRGTQFVSVFWKELNRRLGVILKASLAYHPESDGQTEIVNAYIEQYLRAFCSFYQNDWADWLPLGEFASNNQVSETTGVSPFFANYGWNPSMGTEPTGPPTAADTPAQQKEFHNATTVADRVQAVTEHVKSLAEASRRRYEEAANRHREDAGSFEVGDLVWISTKNMASSRPTDKLNERWIGPFPVTKVYRRALAVELPEQYRVFPVFHLLFVQRYQ
jgi:hypothetical protein